MNSNLQQTLNKAIKSTLNSLGTASARNFQLLNTSFGSEPLKWMPQLSADFERAHAQYEQLLTVTVEKGNVPDMGKVTKALENMLTAAFSLQIITRAASPKIAVVQN